VWKFTNSKEYGKEGNKGVVYKRLHDTGYFGTRMWMVMYGQGLSLLAMDSDSAPVYIPSGPH